MSILIVHSLDARHGKKVTLKIYYSLQGRNV